MPQQEPQQPLEEPSLRGAPSDSAPEFCHIELELPPDMRALGALRGALEHTTAHLGFAPEDALRLSDDVTRICASAFEKLPEDQTLTVLIYEHPDRLEIEIRGPQSSCPNATPQKLGFDLFEKQVAGGQWRWRLVKSYGAAHRRRPHV